MFKKFLMILLCILSLTVLISADEQTPEDDDPLYNYHHDLYDESTSGGEEDRTSFFRVDDMCQVVINESDVTNYDTAIIHEIRSLAKGEEEADNTSTGEKIQYYFTAKSKYFGVYDDLETAQTACKLIFNSANNLKKALWNGNRTFYYTAEGSSDGYKIVINKDCKQPEGSTNCSLSPIRLNREEALSRLFTVINKYYEHDHHIKDDHYWVSNKPDENEEYENYLDGIQYKSFVAEYFNSVFKKSLTSGDIMSLDKKAYKKRIDLNTAVYQERSGRVSAYQRFGPDISFIPYFGEQSFNIGLFGKLYSAMTQDKLSYLVDNLQDIRNDVSTYLSTTVYPGRAPVLTKEDLNSGLNDPRVDAFLGVHHGASAATGNFYLTISKFIFSVITLFLEDSMVNLLWETIEALENSDLWTAIFRPSVAILTGFGMIFFIFSLVKHARKYGFGQEDARPFFGRVFGGIITLGILAIMVIHPTSLNYVPRRLTTFVTEITEYTMMQDPNVQSDDVVYSSDSDGFMSAAIWRKAIFDPWCYGTFLTDYDHLWTYYSGHSESHQLPQSHDDTHTATDEGKVTFDSAGMTGDVGVPLGGDYKSRNWAIFAWSTQSIFHIDSEESRYIFRNEEGDEETREIVSWPNATTTAGNKNIYADDFKWIDAKLNISYQYGEGGHKMPNYTDARSYTEKFREAGEKSLYMSLLLLVIVPTIITKFTHFVYLIIISVNIIVAAIENLFKEKSFTKVFPEYVHHFKEYTMASVKLAILVILYYKLASIYSISNCVLFVFLAVTIQLVNIENIRKTAHTVNRYLETGSAREDIKTTKISILDANESDWSVNKDYKWYQVPGPKEAEKLINEIIEDRGYRGLSIPDHYTIGTLVKERSKEVDPSLDKDGVLYDEVNFYLRISNINDGSVIPARKFKPIHKKDTEDDNEENEEDENT